MRSFIRSLLTIQRVTLTIIILVRLSGALYAQSVIDWYNNAQQRIDTLRKGNFSIRIIDRDNNPFSGEFSVRMIKHEYPFGVAFDLYEDAAEHGNKYFTTAAISAKADAEIYRSERWNPFLAYAIRVEKGRDYKLTLKFAEIYFSSRGSRKFDVFVEGTRFLSGYDVFDAAGGKNIAVDTSLYITPADTLVHIELVALVDNAAIKGIEIAAVEGDSVTRINCGGGALTTLDGNFYQDDKLFLDQQGAWLPTDEQWMRAVMPAYFNYGVSGNSFKWSGIQPRHTAPDYRAFDNAVKWTQSIGWELRAHTLLWGGNNYEDHHALPQWVKDLPTAQAITDTCKMRVIREMTRYKGIIREYDVMNEPLHATYLASRVGDSINWNCFKWARSADPEAELYINEYNVEYYWGDAKKYRDLIKKILSLGIPVTGVGVQAHFWNGMRPDITEFVTQLNIIAEAGLPIKLTEFDNGDLSQEVQATDLIKVITIAFSHPAIHGIIFWNLSDNTTWRPNAGLFEENRKPKLAADTLLYYTRKLWATNFDTVASGDTATMFSAYFGQYSVEVNFRDTVKLFHIPCLAANKDSVFILHEQDAVLKGPSFKDAYLSDDTTLTIVFSQPVSNESVTKGSFKFFSDNALRIKDINADTANNCLVKIILTSSITPDDYLSVSYYPGTLSSVTGGKATAFGPVPVINHTTGLKSATVTNDGQSIEVTFNAKVVNLSENLSSFIVSVSEVPLAINSLDYREQDSSILVLSLASPVVKGNQPVIRYTRGTLSSTHGFLCQSSAAVSVSNIWPSLVRATVNTAGTMVEAVFDRLLQEVIPNKDSFSVRADGKLIPLSGIDESGIDSTRIVFTLAETVYAGQMVTFSYQPGTIRGYNGNRLGVINNTLVTNSSVVAGEDPVTAGYYSVYPNPASTFIKIATVTGKYSVSVYNSQGVLLFNKPGSSGTLTVDVASLARGLYFIQILDANGNCYVVKTVLK
jgi:uncharacterized repeat protein (TIGR02059 family)